MEKSNFKHVGNLFEEFFKQKGFYKKLQEVSAKESWKEIVGPVFSKATQKITIYNNIMYVSINSPAIRHELLLNRNTIKYKINKKIGEDFINEIVIK
ncbi:MAG: DUF721 domain-containing protein [Bacteroidales bacterium]